MARRDSSFRLIVDLQACQTAGSRNRGVGRYSQALFHAMRAAGGGCEIYAVAAEHMPAPDALDGTAENRILRLPGLPQWGAERDFLGGSRDALDAAAYSSFLAPFNADVVHVSHAFEGYSERVAFPDLGRRAPGQLVSATFFDLIPLLYRDHYLRDKSYARWYHSRLAWARRVDLLLAISEATRRDAIGLLGIEPWRIATIHGGISPQFRQPQAPAGEREALARRHGLAGRFVLYAGGDDHRKNLEGAIAGYATLPPELRRDRQLVVVCAMEELRKRRLLEVARSRGLAPEEMVLTGFVPDGDLAAFYRQCDAFVYPSLYEGLGLPVLEAMACGAPVVGGDNSSIREIIARRDALFDAGSESSTAGALARVLTDGSFAADLRRYGLERSREFTWENAAQRALAAFGEALERARERGVQSAAGGWLPRRRLAVFTPLPPCRSGIADYSARFLPFLARHFDIDVYVDGYAVADEALNAAFRVFEARDFEAAAAAYDGILYEMGNSEFHAYMLPLLEKFPGVVGLHDAYLSGLLGWLDFNKGDTGSFQRAMLAAHGPRARRYFAPARAHPAPNGAAVVNLPAIKATLDRALGVISHSPFNRDLARANHPEGWQAPYRVIPQMVPLPRPLDAAQRAAAREALGLDAQAIVIATFGHITWTKWGDRLLQALAAPELRAEAAVHLVYAGELASDDFGRRLGEAIRAAGLGARVRVTGYLSDEDYERYLRVTDIAVQLRTRSRGGTPKGVLDCLAHGVPVVVNAEASYLDYPDGVVTKLGADPTPAEIAAALARLCADGEERRRIAARGRDYVRERHDPENCAAQYAAAIHEFLERDRQARGAALVPAFAPHLAGLRNDSVEAALRWLETVPGPRFERRRLLVDVSHIAAKDHQTGIQRVVKRIVGELYCSDRPGFEPVAVELARDGLRPARGWLGAQGLLAPQEAAPTDGTAMLAFAPGDVLLMLDSSWQRYREFHPVFERARAARVPVYTAVYDLLPLVLPPGNFVEGGKEWFEGWFRDALAQSDGLVCISRSVAQSVLDYARGAPGLARVPRVGWWHLGGDLAAPRAGAPDAAVAALAPGRALAMVGTIEPRKSHAVALAAMERLWARGADLALCIAGREGWMVEELMRTLRGHPLLGERLFLFEQASDAAIDELYARAAGALCLSKGEGFGLPLVEAANHGTPILCSDIPVFREIAGEYATYVSHEEPETLARQLEQWVEARAAGALPDTRGMPRLTWERSAEALLEVVLDNRWLRGEA